MLGRCLSQIYQVVERHGCHRIGAFDLEGVNSFFSLLNLSWTKVINIVFTKTFPQSFAYIRFKSRKTDLDGVPTTDLSTRGRTVVRRRTTSSKKENSILGDMLIGSILFFAGFPCLWFNEKGYAYTKTFLNKYVKLCIVARPEEVDPNN